MLTLRAAAVVFLGVAVLLLSFVIIEGAAPRMVAHAMLALAALPLMMAAMLHFVPVLSRTGAPHRAMTLIPWVGFIAGGLILLAFLQTASARALATTAASLNLAAAIVLLAWISKRYRRCVGEPHPGLFWYVAALVALILAMLAAFGMLTDPERSLSWRRLHLHLNLFGWIGLTVLGTLPVLLPTALREFDSDAAQRLRRGLPWASVAVGILALGAALSLAWLAALGSLGFASVIGCHGSAWWRRYRFRLFTPPAVLLTAAAGGLLLSLVVGLDHAEGGPAGASMLAAFIIGFLLPLVSGALAHLLPVWWYPGVNTPSRQTFAARLLYGARTRAGIFALAGIAQYPGGVLATAGIVAALLAMAVLLGLLWPPSDGARV